MKKHLFNFFENLKKKNETYLFILIGSLIFITIGDNFEDHLRINYLKIMIICLIFTQLNIIHSVKLNIYKYKETSILITLFVISVTISFILSPHEINEFAFKWLRTRYLHTIFDIILFIFLYFYFCEKKINYDYLIKSILIPGIFFSLMLFLNAILEKHISNNSEEILFFDGKRQAGMFLVFVTTFYLGLDYSGIKNYKNYISFTIITLFLSLIFVLQGRGSIISILITYLICIFILKIDKKKLKQKILNFCLCLLISFFLSKLFFLISNYSLIDNGNTELGYAKRENLFMIIDRIVLWKYAISKISENVVFGSGPGSFFIMSFNDLITGNSYPDIYAHTQPHNFILQFLIEWGFIGTSIILYLFVKLFLNSLKILLLKKKQILLIPGLNLIAFGLYGLVDGTLYHPTFTFYFVLSLSVLCSELRRIDRL